MQVCTSTSRPSLQIDVLVLVSIGPVTLQTRLQMESCQLSTTAMGFDRDRLLLLTYIGK